MVTTSDGISKTERYAGGKRGKASNIRRTSEVSKRVIKGRFGIYDREGPGSEAGTGGQNASKGKKIQSTA